MVRAGRVDKRIGTAMGRHQAREDFERFVDQSVNQLLRTAYLITWDLPSAEDLVQESLLRVARRWPKVRSMAYPTAYARRTLINLALDGARRRTRHKIELEVGDRPALEEYPDPRAALALGTVEAAADLQQALGNLTRRQRATLVLRYFEDLPERQVAEILGCSIGTVKSTTWRALERLRAMASGPPAGGRSASFEPEAMSETKGRTL